MAGASCRRGVGPHRAVLRLDDGRVLERLVIGGARAEQGLVLLLASRRTIITPLPDTKES